VTRVSIKPRTKPPLFAATKAEIVVAASAAFEK